MQFPRNNSTLLMCAGIHDLTLRGAKLMPADLTALTALRHLSRCIECVLKGLSMTVGKTGRCQACTIETVTARRHIRRGPALSAAFVQAALIQL